jgi:photosynthetic reaction center H subunit
MLRIIEFTRYIDLAQVALYLFWFFFFALIYYLRKEDKREGYPLHGDRGELKQGFPVPPAPKQFMHASHTTER